MDPLTLLHQHIARVQGAFDEGRMVENLGEDDVYEDLVSLLPTKSYLVTMPLSPPSNGIVIKNDSASKVVRSFDMVVKYYNSSSTRDMRECLIIPAVRASCASMGDEDFTPSLLGASEGVIVTQCVPHEVFSFLFSQPQEDVKGALIYLHMMLEHLRKDIGFVHCDLHVGNVLLRCKETTFTYKGVTRTIPYTPCIIDLERSVVDDVAPWTSYSCPLSTEALDVSTLYMSIRLHATVPRSLNGMVTRMYEIMNERLECLMLSLPPYITHKDLTHEAMIDALSSTV